MEWIPVRFYGSARDVIHRWPLEVKKGIRVCIDKTSER
jgi:hypothetical protein